MCTTASRILVGTMLGALLIGCGSEVANDDGTSREALKNKAQCYKLGEAACKKATQCVMEYTCSSSSEVCGIISTPDNAFTGTCSPPVCESKCRHWKNAGCFALDEKFCGKRNDCQWDCYQTLIGCPPDMPDCGVHCGCNMKNPPSEPPVPGPPGVSPPPGGEVPQVPAYAE